MALKAPGSSWKLLTHHGFSLSHTESRIPKGPSLPFSVSTFYWKFRPVHPSNTFLRSMPPTPFPCSTQYGATSCFDENKVWVA